MLIEKEIEAKILAAISAVLPALLPSHSLVGFWQPAAVGNLKRIEDDPSDVAFIEVMTAQGSQATFSDPDISYPVAVQLTVRADLDPDGSALVAFTDPLTALFREWMGATYQQTFTALDIDDAVSIDNVGVSGSAPAIDLAASVIRVRWDLTLSGSLLTPRN